MPRERWIRVGLAAALAGACAASAGGGPGEEAGREAREEAAVAQPAAWERCLEETTTAEMSECLTGARREAEARLSAVYGEIVPRLSDDEARQLELATVAWSSYREAQCRFQALLYRGGSLAAIELGSCQARLLAERVERLAGLRDRLEARERK